MMGALGALLVGGALGYLFGYWARQDRLDDERELTLQQLCNLADQHEQIRRAAVRPRREVAR